MVARDQIRNERRNFKTFTAVRLSEIHENTNINEWSWVPSERNPADLATRVKELDSDDLDMWKHGPNFLQQPNEYWSVDTVSKNDCQVLPDYIGCVLQLTQKEC